MTVGAKRESGGALANLLPCWARLTAILRSLPSRWLSGDWLAATLPQVGWQSARFCDYPQELGFQFAGPVHLMQLQV